MGASQADQKVKKILIVSNKGPFHICIIMCNEKWILYTQQPAMTSSVVGTKKLQSTSQSQTCTKKWSWSLFGAVVHLTHYSFLNPGETIIPEKRAKQIERHWKLQCLQQVLVNRSSSSPCQHLTAHHITNTFKKLNKLGRQVCLTHHIHLTSCQMT